MSVTSQATGHWPAFVFKGIYILYNIKIPSLLNGCLPWHQWGNFKSLFAYNFPVSDFLLLIKLITRIPHPYCISLQLFFLQPFLCLSILFYSLQMKMIAVSSQWCLQCETPTRDFTTVNYSHNHLRRFDNRADWLILKSTGEVALKTGYSNRQHPDVQSKYLCWEMWW